MTSPRWARRRRARLFGVATGVFGFVAILCLSVFGAGVSAADNGEPVDSVEAGGLVPDVVIGVPPPTEDPGQDAVEDDPVAGETDTEEALDERAASIVAALRRSPAIAWAADDRMQTVGANVLVAFEDGDEAAARVAVQLAIADQLEDEFDLEPFSGPEQAAELVADSDYTVSGRDISDRELTDRVGVGAAMAVLFAALTIGGLVAWRVGPIQGLLSGVTLGVAAWLAGEIGESVAGDFDGSLATTVLPAVFAAIVVSGYLIVRLLVWFESPKGEDQAETIREAIYSVGLELFLALSALAVATLFLELLAPTRSVATVLLAGAVVGAMVTLAVVPPALAVIGPAAEPWWEPIPIPSGREVPILVLVGFALFLTVLGFFAFRSTSDAELLDERALGTDSEAVAGTRGLLEQGGDPTSAVLADFADNVDQAAKTEWLEQASQLEWVERVDTPTGRYEQGVFTAIEAIVGRPGSAEVAEAPTYALVVPGVTGRSAAAIELVGSLEAIDAGVDADLHGPPVDASRAAEGDRSHVWLTILALAVVGGVAVFALVADLQLAGVAVAVRLVTLAGVAGLYHLLVGDVSGQEIQLALLIVALGSGLFELGFLRRLVAGQKVVDTDALLDEALEIEGTAATIAMALGAVAALGVLVPDLTILRRFGILLAVVILIETVVGTWLLRPVMLGSKAVSHFASRPVRMALESLTGSSVSSQAEHRAWVDVVVGLLETEFSFQADPAAADISAVFVAETPLFQKSLEHHQNLAEAGLRIVGRQPQLRALRVVSNAAPPTLVVTVDHPVRQLLDDDGKIVGVRQAERRSVMLWMVMQECGSYRVADSVELGATSLASAEQTVQAAPVVTVAAE
ncbi:MAG: hypothetical protein ACR2QO_14290 [Acidimicrobiales bacterium]